MLHGSQNAQCIGLSRVGLIYKIEVLARWRQSTLGSVFGVAMLHAMKKMATKYAIEEWDTQLQMLRTINSGSFASFIRSRLLSKAKLWRV